MRRNIGQPEIARQKRIDEQPGRHAKQLPDRIDRAMPAHDQEGVFLEPTGHRRDDGVNGEAEGEQNRESADIFHCELFSPPDSVGRRVLWGREREAN